MQTNETIHQLKLQLWNLSYSRYISQEILSIQWWGLALSLLAIYLVWWKLVDKSRLIELLLFGSFVTVIATVIDLFGYNSGHWDYNIRLLPIFPATFPFDFTLVPILLMIALQYTFTWPSYLVGSAFSSAIFSYIIIPLFAATGIKTYYNWKYSYFFALMMGVAIASRIALFAIMKIARKNN